MTLVKPFASVALLIAFLFTGVSATATTKKTTVSPIKAATIMIKSIGERAARERRHAHQLNELLQIELAKVNEYLERGDLKASATVEIKELVVTVSKTVFNREIGHNLHFVNNETTSEQIHNLVALAKEELARPSGDKKLDREFSHRMIGLGKVFHGQGNYTLSDIMSGIRVEHNHPVQIPAPRRSFMTSVRDAAAKAFSYFNSKPEQQVQAQPVLELTEDMIVHDKENSDLAAEAVEAVIRGSGPRTLHPETDRFGKVTARRGNRFCDSTLSPDDYRDLF